MARDRIDFSTASGLGAILLWSTTFAFARSLSEQVGPLTAGAAAYLIGGAGCLVRFALLPAPARRLEGLTRSYVFGCGGLFVFYTAALYLAIGLCRSREQLIEVALVNYLWPSFTVLGSLVLLRKRARLWLAPGTALALVGIFLVLTQDGQVSWGTLRAHVRTNPLAYGLAFAAAVAWALYSNLTRRWSTPGTRGAVELFVPVTGFVLLGLRLLVPEPAGWSVRAAGEATGLAVVTTLSYVLWDLAMRRGNVLLVAAASYLTPLLSTIVSSLYLGVLPGIRLWVGCGLLVLGSILTWRSVFDGPPRR